MYTNHLSAPSDHTRKYYKLLVQTLLYGLQAKYKGGTTGGAMCHHSNVYKLHIFFYIYWKLKLKCTIFMQNCGGTT